jgi:hypothetical protein
MKKFLTALTVAAGITAALPTEALAAPAAPVSGPSVSLGWQQVRVFVGWRTRVRYVQEPCGCGVIPITERVPVYDYQWVYVPDCGC